MSSVVISLQIYIPSEAVRYSMLAYGGTFNGGSKCQLQAALDLDRSGDASLSAPKPSWAITHRYQDSDSVPLTGKPEWFQALKPGARSMEQGQLERTEANLRASFHRPGDATHGVRFIAVGANPLLKLAPAIDADVVVGLKKIEGRWHYMIAGEHDGFPNYTVTVGADTAYHHDCVVKNETPAALAPPMDYAINVGWRLVS